MENLAEMIINASFYIFFVAFSGGLGLTFAALIGIKIYAGMSKRAERKATKNTKRVRGAA